MSPSDPESNRIRQNLILCFFLVLFFLYSISLRGIEYRVVHHSTSALFVEISRTVFIGIFFSIRLIFDNWIFYYSVLRTYLDFSSHEK